MILPFSKIIFNGLVWGKICMKTPIFSGNNIYGFRLRFSFKPILWHLLVTKIGWNCYHCCDKFPIFWGYISLHRPYIGLIYGRYLQFRILKFPLLFCNLHPVLFLGSEMISTRLWSVRGVLSTPQMKGISSWARYNCHGVCSKGCWVEPQKKTSVLVHHFSIRWDLW